MLPDVGMPCIPVLEDNEGAVQLAQDPYHYVELQAHRCATSFSQRTGRKEGDFGHSRIFLFAAC